MRILRRIPALMLILCLLGSCGALAEGTYYGSVVCENAQTVLAPFGGVVADLNLRKGGLLAAGSEICSIETTFVYSPVAGTVSAVFGAGGDSVEEVKNRRGGVVYIIPENRFCVDASDKDSTRNPDCHISVGQEVWLQMGRKNAPIIGSGIVTSVGTEAEAGNYTVEIVSGVFSPDDSVAVYRKDTADPSALLGFGTVRQTPPVVISGEGSILRVHVKPGSTVSRGTLLFETVSGALREMKNGDNRVFAKEDGIVASVEAVNGSSVEQGSTLITLYPLGSMRVCITVPETSLALFPVGQKVNLTFGTGDEREGTVQSVDYLADADETGGFTVGYANYKVYIDFEQKEGIRQGMLVTVDLPPVGEAPAEIPEEALAEGSGDASAPKE